MTKDQSYNFMDASERSQDQTGTGKFGHDRLFVLRKNKTSVMLQRLHLLSRQVCSVDARVRRWLQIYRSDAKSLKLNGTTCCLPVVAEEDSRSHEVQHQLVYMTATVVMDVHCRRQKPMGDRMTVMSAKSALLWLLSKLAPDINIPTGSLNPLPT